MNFVNKKILIIEDDDKLRFNLEKMLKKLDFIVKSSYSSIDTHCDEISNDLLDTDLVLLDINLPGEIDGVTFAKSIRDDYEVPILYVTGNVEPSTFADAMEGRIYGYLPKPFSKLQLDYQMKISLYRYQKEIEAKERMKKIKEREKLIQVGEFAGGFVHDLNNFNSLIMNSYALIRQVAKPEEEEPFCLIHDFVEKGELGANHIKKLAHRYRKIILNSAENKKETIVLQDLIHDVSSFFEFKFKQNDIQLIVDVPPEVSIFSNEVVLVQAIVNLISNAIYEIIDRQMQERWIKIAASIEEGNLSLQITDSGPGIREEVIEDIFEFGYSTKKQSENEGSGVGLSFVRSSIESELGGRIEILKGAANTTFSIQIPHAV